MKGMVKRTGSAAWLILIVAFMLFATVSIGYLMMKSMTGDQINALRHAVKSFGFYMQFLRWGLYLALFIYWDKAIRFLGHLRHWEPVMIERGVQSRYQSIAILLAVELFVIQAIQVPIIGFFINLLNH